MGHEYRDLYY
jgi:hypothetical protein